MATQLQPEGSQAPIDDQHQRMLGPPATHLLDHLANPIQAGFVTRRIPIGILFLGPTRGLFILFLFLLLRRRLTGVRRRRLFGGRTQRRQKRQPPYPITPRHGYQQLHRHPLQPETKNHMRRARTHRIAITTHLPNLLPPTTLYGIIGPQDDRMAGRHKGRYQQAQQDATPLERAPPRPIQHPVKVGEVCFLRPTYHPQHRRHRTFTRGQEGAHQQQLSMRPDAVRKQWREYANQAYYIIHGRISPGLEGRLVCLL